jgi:uncharacterized protein
MTPSETQLDQLETLLGDFPEGCEPMLVSELDGFMAAAIICPDLISPTKWVEKILGFAVGQGAPVFENPDTLQKALDALMEHYNDVIDNLFDGRYGPVCDIDQRNDEIIWVLWADGFGQFLDRYPRPWSAIMRSNDKNAIAAFAGLKRLADIARDDTGAFAELSDADWQEAPTKIAEWVVTLNDWRLEQADASVSSARGKVGRNERCPCGSGKKYKKCCGLN